MQFTDKQLELIAQALAFSSCAEVCASWSIEQSEAMCDIAQEITNELNIDELSNLDVGQYVDEEYSHIHDVIKTFVKVD